MQRKASYKATPFKRPSKAHVPQLARSLSITAARAYAAGKRTAPTGEVKYLDTTLSFLFDTTGEVPATGQLNLIPVGTGESERIGRKVHLKSIRLRGHLSPNTPDYQGEIIRLMLVQDKQCNGAAATYSGVNGVLSADTVSAFRNLDNQDRFIIHKDWFFTINPTAGVTTSFNLQRVEFDFYKKLNVPIEFDSTVTTGALTTIRSNNFFLLARSVANDDVFVMNGLCRIRYVDG